MSYITHLSVISVVTNIDVFRADEEESSDEQGMRRCTKKYEIVPVQADR